MIKEEKTMISILFSFIRKLKKRANAKRDSIITPGQFSPKSGSNCRLVEGIAEMGYGKRNSEYPLKKLILL